VFNNFYSGKRVLVTGHTGFKGSWLTLWLLRLGAEVTGYSVNFPSTPCNFEILELEKRIDHVVGDIRDLDSLNKIFQEKSPEIVFHLAAQSLVFESYDKPKLTFDTNLGGTVNVLECIRKTPSVKVGVIITSDKCYQNHEWSWGYRENDRLGGDDPYSASKACAEIAFQAYIHSFFCKGNSNEEKDVPSIATTRAGNVLGGGDWALNRIVPDCVKSWAKKEAPFVRNPHATRPWQHVLEPLSGYLWLGAKLADDSELHGESFNFGPSAQTNKPVKEVIETFLLYWGKGDICYNKADNIKKENSLLKLSCDKALQFLEWYALLTFEETMQLTAEWYKTFYEQQKKKKKEMFDFALRQIEFYTTKATKEKILWGNDT
jgi:CDP-glucose 4,6-dehydratase